jgi:coproporphyrinogen III oxidase-like Fe-S oxidoreductase
MAAPVVQDPAQLHAIRFNPELFHKLGQQGPRYTSYPRADRFTDGFRMGDYLQTVSGVRAMGDLMSHLRRWFQFVSDKNGEYSIEVDPRSVTAERIHSLRAQGFNRISWGGQDFDADVQQAVNRIQPERQTLQAIDAAPRTPT